MECHCFWFLDRWLFGRSKYVFILVPFGKGWLTCTVQVVRGLPLVQQWLAGSFWVCSRELVSWFPGS